MTASCLETRASCIADEAVYFQEGHDITFQEVHFHDLARTGWPCPKTARFPHGPSLSWSGPTALSGTSKGVLMKAGKIEDFLYRDSSCGIPGPIPSSHLLRRLSALNSNARLRGRLLFCGRVASLPSVRVAASPSTKPSVPEPLQPPKHSLNNPMETLSPARSSLQ